jgi:DNA modification methylase
MNTKIVVGCSQDTLKRLPAESIHCCVTSPPYFGLRDYGLSGQIGLEKTVEEYVEKMMLLFREVRRVLKKDGTLWLNLGDSYARQAGDDSTKNPDSGMKTGRTGKSAELFKPGCNKPPEGLKQKDLIGIPWRVAFALQADGWYLRQDIIWAKPNPMPESVKDRCTKAHEYIFLMSKSPKYYFDAVAIQEEVTSTKGNAKSFRGGGSYTGGNSFDNSAEKERETSGNTVNESGMKNKRSVWTVATQSYKEAHFATYPEKLIEPCILAGCPEGGVVLDPFGGSGTTGKVANDNGRRAILLELNPAYADLALKRIGAERTTILRP